MDYLSFAIERVRAMKLKRPEPEDNGDVHRIDVLQGRVNRALRLLKWGSTLRGPLCELRYRIVSLCHRFTPDFLLPAARIVYRAPRRLIDSLGPERKVAAYRGFEMHYSKGTSLIEWVRGGRIYEPDVSRRLIEALMEHDSPLFLDIGANIGLITLNVLAEIPSTRVVAFEPGPHQAGLLEGTIATNELSNRVTLVRSALGREVESMDFEIHESRHASGDGFLNTNRAGRTQTIQVQVMPLDSWWREAGTPNVHVIKIDTEGAELWILEGGEAMIERCRPTVLFELHPDNLRVYPHKAADVIQFFLDRHYIVQTIRGDIVAVDSVESWLNISNDYVAVYGHG